MLWTVLWLTAYKILSKIHAIHASIELRTAKAPKHKKNLRIIKTNGSREGNIWRRGKLSCFM